MRSLLLALSVGLAICATQTRAADLEKASISLSVGGKTLVAYLPLTIAERRGYFTEGRAAGRNQRFPGRRQGAEALVGGSADIVCGAYEHTLFMANKGLAIKAIALQANSFGLVVGVQKDKAPSYQSLKDLKGMKFGVTGRARPARSGCGCC